MFLRKEFLFITFITVLITTTKVIAFNAAPSPDFDGDGVVDKFDLRALIGVYGSREGEANYDAKYDLDGDDVIAKGDLKILIGSYGQTVSPSDGGDEEMVAIPDMNLRAVIEDSLNKASGATITRGEMATLTHFAASDANISDLTGLEFATGLTVLVLSKNSISDLTPLCNLTSLPHLILDSNSIVDLSPLSGMTNLTWLTLSKNSIVDLSPLSGLTSLIALVLSDNLITDISPLVTNTGLGSGDEVDVRNNPLSATSITHIPALRSRGVTVGWP